MKLSLLGPILFNLSLLLAATHQTLADEPAVVTVAEEPSGNVAAEEVRYDGRTIRERIGDWDANNISISRKALDALASIGTPAVEELTTLIKSRHRHSGLAIQTLAKMGEQSRGALPLLLEMGGDRQFPDPEEWTWNVPIRALLFSEAKNMSWAADQWIPVLGRVAKDSSEPEINRQRAIFALGSMGVDAKPILMTLATDDNDEIRKAANNAIAVLEVAGGRSKTEVYREIIERDPLDANVPDYLVQTKSSFNHEQIHPLTQQVKAALRKRIAEQPDAELAWTLATIIRNGLAGTDLMFAAPSDSVRSRWLREDPAESYATLAEALEAGLNAAAEDSEQARRGGLSLARLRLLQGNWQAMNEVLERVGQQPVPASRRPTLPAPPFDWSRLEQDWQPADASMRSGNCSIEFHFEKEGHGLAGAHVLMKQRPAPQQVFYTGIDVDTLLYATQPLDASPYDPFGYRGQDRMKTRYGVSDNSGVIRFKGLPEMPIVVEVLIPTANFPEAGRSWDLVMEVAPGDVRPAWWGHPNSVSRQEGPAIVALKAGETVSYPKFIVRPHLMSSVTDWSPADGEEFVLSWQPLDKSVSDVDHYELELMLTAPCQHSDMISQQRVIQSSTQEVRGTEWEIGKKGVGEQRLRPGNLYMLEVRAIDPEGGIVARLPWTRVWVPWKHRESLPPAHGDDRSGSPPFYDRIWWKTSTTLGDGTRTELSEAVIQYLPASTDRFEYEYVLIGQAWLSCLDGLDDVGRKLLTELAEDLPPGNVVRGTARALLQQLNSGKPLSKRFEFVADE